MIEVQETTAPGQMVSHADATIAELEQRLAVIAQEMREAHTALITIEQARVARSQSLQEARTACEQADSEHNQAVSYALLAADTTNERRSIQAVSTAKKALNAARTHLERIERETTEVDQVAINREQELNLEIDRLQSERGQVKVKIQSVRAGREQAYRELGEQKHAAIVAGYGEHLARVDAIHRQLIDAQVELHTFHQGGLVELAGWPEHHKAFMLLAGVEDSTSRMITATLNYAEALSTDGLHINHDVALPWELRDVMHIREGDLNNPGPLSERMRRLRQVQAVYYEWLAAHQQ